MTLLQLDAITAGYGAKTVLTDVSLSVAPGEILALLGHNGAGKTTTLRAIMGLITPSAGRLRFDGADLAGIPTAERVHRGLRLLPEGRGVFPDLTVLENLAVVAARNVTETALFRPADVLALFPALVERARVRAGRMSGGQQQMLAMGLAVLGTPRCLLLDEPSIGLAPNLVERLFEQVQSLCRNHGMAAILVEQNVAAAMRIADRVVIMNNGALVFDGTPAEARAGNVWDYF